MTHRVVEGEAQDLDEEVDGVTSFVPLWPAPIAVFEDQALEGTQKEVARHLFQRLQSLLLKQWTRRGQSGGADLSASLA